MTKRLSSLQYTIMRNVVPRDESQANWPILKIARAIELNQAVFYSLLRGDLLRYNSEVDAFRMTDAGLKAMDAYRHGDIGSLVVKNNPDSRQERVQERITSTASGRKRQKKLAVKSVAA